MRTRLSALLAILISLAGPLQAVPQMIQWQGRLLVGTTPFHGNGQFKFALVNDNGSVTYWSNDGSSANGSEPTAAVTLSVVRGTYGVLLGDPSLANMTTIPLSVFSNNTVRLRVWFKQGATFELMAPDQKLAAVAWALTAGEAQSVADGAITTSKLASGAVGTLQLANNAVTSAALADGAVGAAQLGAGLDHHGENRKRVDRPSGPCPGSGGGQPTGQRAWNRAQRWHRNVAQ